VEFLILGPLEVVGDAGPIRLGGPKQRATLAILLLHANSIVSVDRLADDLYAGAAPVTAVTQVQRQISELRKALAPPHGAGSPVETRTPGYVIRLASEQLDLDRFERRTEEATRAQARGDAELAADLLRDALRLWRGAPLADLAYEPFAQVAIERLEEMRLSAIELRIRADLALGSHAALVGELQALVDEYPLREQLRAQLMLALYRSGRQAEALDVYRRTREMLVERFGIEPSRALHELERAILTQDPSLDREPTVRSPADGPFEAGRVVLVLPCEDVQLDALLTIAEPLARFPRRELMIARLLTDDSELAGATSALNARRAALSVTTRSAAFTSMQPAEDITRLVTAYDVELMLLDAPQRLDGDLLPDDLATILEHSPADVALLARGAPGWNRGSGVFVAFGGGEHDWAALELGAWLAVSQSAPVRLVGTTADPRRGQRDASRLLADAALAVQRLVGVDAEPQLAERSDEALVAAVAQASVVVVGISPRWRREGIGDVRRALVRDAVPPILLVHRGLRPGGLAPRESLTRFTWSIGR
jgi:DNA-binding SARP family transcriptional activator